MPKQKPESFEVAATNSDGSTLTEVSGFTAGELVEGAVARFGISFPELQSIQIQTKDMLITIRRKAEEGRDGAE